MIVQQQQDVEAQLMLRIQALMAAYDRLREEKEALAQQVGTLQRQLQLKEEDLDRLKGENEKLHLSRVFLANSADAQDAKAKVNRIVREIDHCIALLNR